MASTRLPSLSVDRLNSSRYELQMGHTVVPSNDSAATLRSFPSRLPQIAEEKNQFLAAIDTHPFHSSRKGAEQIMKFPTRGGKKGVLQKHLLGIELVTERERKDALLVEAANMTGKDGLASLRLGDFGQMPALFAVDTSHAGRNQANKLEDKLQGGSEKPKTTPDVAHRFGATLREQRENHGLKPLNKFGRSPAPPSSREDSDDSCSSMGRRGSRDTLFDLPQLPLSRHMTGGASSRGNKIDSTPESMYVGWAPINRSSNGVLEEKSPTGRASSRFVMLNRSPSHSSALSDGAKGGSKKEHRTERTRGSHPH